MSGIIRAAPAGSAWIFNKGQIMNRGRIILALIMALTGALSVSLGAQSRALSFSPGPAETGLKNNGDQGFELNISIPEAKLENIQTKGGTFSRLSLEGYSPSGRTGEPELPVLSKLIAVPLGASVSFEVTSRQESLFSQAESGLEHPLVPTQPSLAKSQDPDKIPFAQDPVAYSRDDFTENPLFRVEEVGMMRGVRVFQFYFEPARYNPVSGELKITHEASIRVDFSGGDPAATEELLRRTASFEFEKLYRATLFNWRADDRDWLVRTPVKMLILCPTTCTTFIQPFVTWKSQQGIITSVQTVGSGGDLANNAATIKTYLQGVWDAATADNPAPTYLLIVGDISGTVGIVTNTGATGTHPTDLTYARLSGTDYLPELYYGRFSASTLLELSQVISKTVTYEKTQMPDLSYLGKAVLIGGADPDHGPVEANGQVNYGTFHYFNNTNGVTTNAYLYPASETSDAAIIANANEGRGFMNYTAHAWEGGWGDPLFDTTDVLGMSNLNKYGVMVGNACLTGKFDVASCFGEALLRRALRGAVGYIGASNNTYWSEDYWWAVGNKTPQAAAHPYDATKLGAFDAMFHTHGEAQDDWATNLGQTVYMGNSAVQQSSSGRKDYYWEVYNIMGDPSLTTYTRVPSAMSVSHTTYLTPQITNTVAVNTGVAYALVGISRDGVRITGGYANSSGVYTAGIYPGSVSEYTLTVTAPNRISYFGTIHAGHIWTGAESTNWGTPGNWNCGTEPTSTNHVLIPGGLTTYPVTGSAARNCYNLSIESGASVLLNNSNLNVANDLFTYGAIIITGAVDLNVDGNILWRAGSTASISSPSAEIYCAKNMTFESEANVVMAMGYVEFDGTGDSFLHNYSANTRLYHIRSNVEGVNSFIISETSSQDIYINGTLYNYARRQSLCAYSGNVFLKGNLNDYNTDPDRGVRWNSGTLVTGGTNLGLTLTGGDAWLNNLKINSTGTVTLNTDLVVKGSLTIASGVLSVSNHTVKVAGNWINQVGPAAFSEGTSRVIFNGPSHQYVNGNETFNILEVANGAALRFSAGSTTVCAMYDWTSGGIDVNAAGVSFTANDLSENGIAGGWWLSAVSSIDLYSPSGGWIDLKGSLYIGAGSFNVHGGTTASYWPYGGNASITMNGGLLNFPDQGIILQNSNDYTFSANISGGIIRMAGNFQDYRGDFTPSGGTIEMTGPNDANVTCQSGSNLHRLVINKSSAKSGEETGSTYVEDKDGRSTPLTRSANVTISACVIKNELDIQNANTVTISGNVSCMNAAAVKVANGTLKVNAFTFSTTGDININSGGRLELTPGAVVLVSTGRVVHVNSGGVFQAVGNSSNNALISVNGTGYYGLQVHGGGSIGAAYATFQYLNSIGVYLFAGSTVDATNSFNYCVFRNGAPNGALLRIYTEQSFTITGASFPTNAGGTAVNVFRSLYSGHVYLNGWSGAFGGPAYENDPFNRVWWSGSGIPPVETLSISFVPSPDRIRLDWVYPFPATRYNIYRSPAPDGTYVYQGYTTNLTWSQTVPGDRYFYLVKAVGP